MSLKIPPLALLLVAAVLMVLLSRVWPWPGVAVPIVGSALALLGVIVCALGIVAFHRARTTVNPLHPEQASTLVVRGIYRHTRNPMYLGFALLLTGFAAWLGSLAALLVVPLFVVWLDRFQIAPEEGALRARFGANFDAYCARVRRWL